MTYVSLYRRFRPQTFDDVVGQSHVTRTLVNALTEDRLHHAYLFTGPRGTGKTSTARILAKAINCEQGPTPTPCNACQSCVEITSGSSVDVIELDMASHGGVDDARELRDRALFAPARSRRRVYILDEVHMASTAAFNALLKLIEEPPAHVLFAMATTDPQKVPPTILSRVQRLDLRRVDADSVAGQIRRICDAEGYSIDEDAVDAVVRAGDGSLRDALSVLEQVLAFAGSHVTGASVAQVVGRTPDDLVEDVATLLASRDVAGLLVAVQRLVDEGHDLRRFTLDLAQHVRDLLVLQVAPEHPDLVDTTAERRQRLAAGADRLSPDALVGALGLLGETVAEQRQTSPRLPLELALARLAVIGGPTSASETVAPAEMDVPEPAADATGSASPEVARVAEAPATAHAEAEDAQDPRPELVDVVDLTGAEPAPDDVAADGAAPDVDDAHAVGPPDVTADTTTGSDGAEEDLARVTAAWPDILESVKHQSRRCHALFDPAVVVRVGRGMLTLRYGRRYASFHAANARKAEFADTLRAAIQQKCGLDLRLEIVIEGEDERRRPLPPSITPDDARVVVVDAGPTDQTAATSRDPRAVRPDAAEVATARAVDDEVDVREAEHGQLPPTGDVTELLASELGAQLVEEHPARED